MGKITLSSENPPNGQEGLSNWVAQFAKDTTQQVNGNITFRDNIRAVTLEIEFTSANADVIIRHPLNVVPTGYIVVGRDAVITIYDGSIPNTNAYAVFRASAVGNCKIILLG